MEETEFQLKAGALTLWLQVPSKLGWTEILFKTALRGLIPRCLQMLLDNGDDMSHKPAGYPCGLLAAVIPRRSLYVCHGRCIPTLWEFPNTLEPDDRIGSAH